MKPIVLAALIVALSGFAIGSDCKQPLDPDTLSRVQLGSFDGVQLQPGQTRQFQVVIPVGCAPDIKVPACVVWEVKPAGKGAVIDQTGLLSIDAKTPAGSKFTVIAHIEKGRAERGSTVLAYTPQSQPLVGLWRQTDQYDCGSGERIHAPPIGELELRASGWFSVTWQPFETYRDYWGGYSSDNTKQTLALKIGGGNFVPKDFHGDGSYKVLDENTLELDGLYLGSRDTDRESGLSHVPSCRYVFKLISRGQ